MTLDWPVIYQYMIVFMGGMIGGIVLTLLLISRLFKRDVNLN